MAQGAEWMRCVYDIFCALTRMIDSRYHKSNVAPSFFLVTRVAIDLES